MNKTDVHCCETGEFVTYFTIDLRFLGASFSRPCVLVVCLGSVFLGSCQTKTGVYSPSAASLLLQQERTRRASAGPKSNLGIDDKHAARFGGPQGLEQEAKVHAGPSYPVSELSYVFSFPLRSCFSLKDNGFRKCFQKEGWLAYERPPLGIFCDIELATGFDYVWRWLGCFLAARYNVTGRPSRSSLLV